MVRELEALPVTCSVTAGLDPPATIVTCCRVMAVVVVAVMNVVPTVETIVSGTGCWDGIAI